LPARDAFGREAKRLLVCRASLHAAQGATEQRSEQANVEQTGEEWHCADHGHDDASRSADAQQTPGDQGDTRHDPGNATNGGSHKENEGIHFASRWESRSKTNLQSLAPYAILVPGWSNDQVHSWSIV